MEPVHYFLFTLCYLGCTLATYELWPAASRVLVQHEPLLFPLLGSLRSSSAIVLTESVGLKPVSWVFCVSCPSHSKVNLVPSSHFCHVQTQRWLRKPLARTLISKQRTDWDSVWAPGNPTGSQCGLFPPAATCSNRLLLQPQPTVLHLQLETSAEKSGYSAELKHTPLSATAASHVLQKSSELRLKAESWTCRWRKHIQDKCVKSWIRNYIPNKIKCEKTDFYSRLG